MRTRLTLAADRELPEHLLADTESALQHVGWLGIRRRPVHAPPLHGLHFEGLLPPVTTSHAGHDHVQQIADLCHDWTSLGVACAVVGEPLATTPPALLVMDVDSTLITAEVIELVADRAGVRAEVERITTAAMRGELEFKQALAERVRMLAGVQESVWADIVAEVALSPGAQRLIDAVHATGGVVGVVSGGFHEVVDAIATRAGIDHVRANRLEVADGRLTGRTVGPVVDGTVKEATLREWSALHPGPVVAIGDGANDLAMLRSAHLGVAYCAKPVLAEAADAAIPFPRLDAAGLLAGLSLT